MAASRYPEHLVRWSWLLVAGGILILLAAITFLAAALYHVSQLTGYGPTFVVLAPAPTVAFALTSLVVLAGSCLTWLRSRRGPVLAGRLALAAIIATVAAWLAVGVAFMALTGSGGAA